MRRRDLITMLGGVVAVPLAAHAQQAPIPIIGILGSETAESVKDRLAFFWQYLSSLGFVEGQNVGADYRWAEGHLEHLEPLASDLMARGVRLILTVGGTQTAVAAKVAAPTVPLVFVMGSDPVSFGLVASFNRPLSNATGVVTQSADLIPKAIEILNEVAPKHGPLGVFLDSRNSAYLKTRTELESASQAFGRHLLFFTNLAPENELDTAFDAMSRQDVAGFAMVSDPYLIANAKRIVALAAHYRIPGIYQAEEFAEEGGLLIYGWSTREVFHRVAVLSAKILQGARPGDLPVEQVTRVTLAVNLKTAKTLGITIPQSILARADEVIE